MGLLTRATASALRVVVRGGTAGKLVADGVGRTACRGSVAAGLAAAAGPATAPSDSSTVERSRWVAPDEERAIGEVVDRAVGEDVPDARLAGEVARVGAVVGVVAGPARSSADKPRASDAVECLGWTTAARTAAPDETARRMAMQTARVLRSVTRLLSSSLSSRPPLEGSMNGR
jgi:hypothetical protein